MAAVGGFGVYQFLYIQKNISLYGLYLGNEEVDLQ